tara:strand:+ start:2761 stop:3204 length:444 start_codon:yes stop_codon:yes gene_type:complete
MAMRTIYSTDKDSIFSGQSAEIGPRDGRPVGWVTAETPPPDGIAQWNGNGWTMLDQRPVPDPAVALAQERAAMTCSRAQGKTVIGADIWDQVTALAEDATTPWGLKVVIYDTYEWNRLDPNMDALIWAMGMTPTEADDLFTAAMALA